MSEIKNSGCDYCKYYKSIGMACRHPNNLIIIQLWSGDRVVTRKDPIDMNRDRTCPWFKKSRWFSWL